MRYYVISYIALVAVTWLLVVGSRPRRRWSDVVRSLLDPTLHLLALTSTAALAAPLAEYLLWRWPLPLPLHMAGGAAMLGSGVLSLVANRTLGRAFTPFVDAAATRQEIIRTGVYKYIRHPLYAAGFLLAAGAPLALACRFSWFFTALCWVAILLRTAREERLLQKNMPGYLEYMRHTKRFIPWVL